MDYIKALVDIVGEKNVKTDQIERLCHSKDMSVHEGIPDAIVFAKTTEEVSKILKLANDNAIKVIPRGSGTSTTGAVLACFGGIVLDVSRMNKIKEINRKTVMRLSNPGSSVQPSMPPLPLPIFSLLIPEAPPLLPLAGWSQPMRVETVRSNTAQPKTTSGVWKSSWLTGRVMQTGSTVPKTSSGYDLAHLFCRAEGTLGVITEITVKILPMPEYIAYAQLKFASIEDAGKPPKESSEAEFPLLLRDSGPGLHRCGQQGHGPQCSGQCGMSSLYRNRWEQAGREGEYREDQPDFKGM